MLLGAWSIGNFRTILDIGTGTGILALMMAQQHPTALITALEPDLPSLQEACINFDQSPFQGRIRRIQARLQEYQPDEKFELIISNPPYFERSTLSPDGAKNQARHTASLPVPELYSGVAALLDKTGFFNLIIPFELENLHLEAARQHLLFPCKILRTLREDGTCKRSLISLAFQGKLTQTNTLLVKHSNNRYSSEYIALTRDFYATDLAAKAH